MGNGMCRTASRRRFWRWTALGLVAPWLLATGPCLTTLERSVINGFFDGITTVMVDRLRDELGLSAAAAADSVGD